MCDFVAWAREVVENTWALGGLTNWDPVLTEPTWACNIGGTYASVRSLGEAFVLSDTFRILVGWTSARVASKHAYQIGLWQA